MVHVPSTSLHNYFFVFLSNMKYFSHLALGGCIRSSLTLEHVSSENYKTHLPHHNIFDYYYHKDIL